MNECEYCGNKVSGQVEICPMCGSRLLVKERVNAGYSPPKYTQINHTNSKLLTTYVIIFVSVFMCIGGFLSAMRSSTSTKSTALTKSTTSEPSAENSLDIIELNKMFQANTKDIEANIGLTKYYVNKNMPDAATYHLKFLLDLDLSDVEIYKDLAACYEENGYESEAEKILQTVYAKSNQVENLLTTEEAFNESPFRQAIEIIYNREINKITWDEIKQIKYLYLEPEKINYSFDALRYDEDKNSAVKIVIDRKIDSLDSVNLFGGLETLVVKGIPVNLNNMKTMENLKELILFNSGSSEDFTSFEKFPRIESLMVSGTRLTSFKGLTEMKNLRSLSLNSTGISDLSILATMKNIDSLTLINNKDLLGIQTLEQMSGLKKLHLEDNEYSDLHVIGNLLNLESLTISKTKTKNVNFLGSLTKLKYLKINDNGELLGLPDLSAITSLESLYIDCQKFEDVKFLNDLKTVKTMTLINPNSLEPLRNFKNLERLDLDFGWLLEDVSPLGDLQSLTYFNLINGHTYGEVKNIKAIGKMANLETLDLANCEHYFNCDFIYDMVNLQELRLSQNYIIGDFSKIKNLKNLKRLSLDKVHFAARYSYQSDGFFVSISTSDELPFKKFADDISALTGLEELYITKNNIDNLEFVSRMHNLKILSAGDNYITDVSPLKDLKGLTVLDLSKNSIENWNELDGLINTKIIGR